MDAKDWNSWKEFRESQNETISVYEQKLIAELHSKLFNHKYIMPCTCKPSKARKMFETWIRDINKLYEKSPKPRVR